MKTILVTGSTDGIGKEAARYFLDQGHHVIIHGRNKQKLKQVANELQDISSSSNVSTVLGDYASFQSVLDMAQALLSNYTHLDVLVNNAGALTWKRSVTVDGNEFTLQVNHLSHVLLTLHVLPLLMNPKHSESRIINVSSMIHASTIDFSNLQGTKHYSPYYAYSQSKLCNIFFTNELASRLQGYPVTVNAIHPGVLNTKLLREFWGSNGGTPRSETLHYVALASELKGVTGKYFENKRITSPRSIALDKNAQKQCWEQTLHLLHDYLPSPMPV